MSGNQVLMPEFLVKNLLPLCLADYHNRAHFSLRLFIKSKEKKLVHNFLINLEKSYSAKVVNLKTLEKRNVSQVFMS